MRASVGVLPGLAPALDFHTSTQARNGLRPLYKSANVSRGQPGAQASPGAPALITSVPARGRRREGCPGSRVAALGWALPLRGGGCPAAGR